MSDSGKRKPIERPTQLSSFNQVIRGVESLVNEQEDSPIGQFELPRQPSLRKGLSSCMTNGQKLVILMRSQQVRDRIGLHLRQNVLVALTKGYMDYLPILKLWLVKTNRRQKEPQLTQQELQEVFKRFGHCEKIIIKASGTYALFSDYCSAYFAEKALNDILLESLQARLMVQWCPPSEYQFLDEYLLERIGTQEVLYSHSSQPKFTCRYEIQIDNDKEFQVARKIIGNKGYNMKRIIDACLGEIGADPKTQPDCIKLRLRGKGSGYKEGANRLESGQPLHLCVSCRDEGIYKKACKLVQELLRGVYKEYKSFSLKNGRRIDQLSVKKFDLGEPSVSQCRTSPEERRTESSHASTMLQLDRISESEIKSYIEARNKARRQLNFTEADRIRNYLKGRNVVLIDEKGGRGRGVEVTTWRFSS